MRERKIEKGRNRAKKSKSGSEEKELENQTRNKRANRNKKRVKRGGRDKMSRDMYKGPFHSKIVTNGKGYA